MHGGGAGNRKANLVIGSAGIFEIIEAQESDAKIRAGGMSATDGCGPAQTREKGIQKPVSTNKTRPPQQALDNTLKGNSIILTEIRLFLSLCFRNHRADASC